MKKLILAVFVLSLAALSSGQIKRPAGACCAFSVYNSDAASVKIDALKEVSIVFDQEYFDDGNAWNKTSFKAPSEGTYLFDFTLLFKATNNSAAVHSIRVTLEAGKRRTNKLVNVTANYNGSVSAGMQGIYKLRAGEIVMVKAICLDDSLTAFTVAGESVFSGVKLY